MGVGSRGRPARYGDTLLPIVPGAPAEFASSGSALEQLLDRDGLDAAGRITIGPSLHMKPSHSQRCLPAWRASRARHSYTVPSLRDRPGRAGSGSCTGDWWRLRQRAWRQPPEPVVLSRPDGSGPLQTRQAAVSEPLLHGVLIRHLLLPGHLAGLGRGWASTSACRIRLLSPVRRLDSSRHVCGPHAPLR